MEFDCVRRLAPHRVPDSAQDIRNSARVCKTQWPKLCLEDKQSE
ncbi:hypothetical protein LEMLEM_LOCUS1324 [Lemmus lemmus]